MNRGNTLIFDDESEFNSLSGDTYDFPAVFNRILCFMKEDRESSYKISVGTDSHVSINTVLVSCILVHRIGRGAIGFMHKGIIPRPIKNLREKIYLETCTSLQLAYMFDESKMADLLNTVHKKGVTFEFHIDIGTKGDTKTLISEMMGMVKGINYFVARIKPDSYCASCLADRYTKVVAI